MKDYYDKFMDWYRGRNPNLQLFILAVGIMVMVSLIVGVARLF